MEFATILESSIYICMDFVARIRRCAACSREMKVPDSQYREHPFCRRCFKQRLATERGDTRIVGFTVQNGYMEAIVEARETRRR